MDKQFHLSVGAHQAEFGLKARNMVFTTIFSVVAVRLADDIKWDQPRVVSTHIQNRCFVTVAHLSSCGVTDALAFAPGACAPSSKTAARKTSKEV